MSASFLSTARFSSCSTHSYILGGIAGLIAALVISGVFAWLALRLDGDAFGILSITVQLSLMTVVLNWTSLTRGTLGIPRIPRMAGLESLSSFAITMVIVAGAFVFL